MKVMQINSYPNGSTGAIAKSIHNALQKNGDESVFAYGIGNSSANEDYKIGTDLDFKFHTCSTLLTGLHGYNSVKATKRLIEFIKTENPDIIHLHNIHGGYVNLQILLNFLKKYNKKTVITLHDCWLFTGNCYHFFTAGCEKWKESCGGCPQKSMYPKSLFLDRTKKMLEDKKSLFKDFSNLQIVAVSNWLASVAEESFLGEHPISVIHNGINTNVFYPRSTEKVKEKYGLSDKFVILGVAASWNSNKGLKDFISLSQKLKEDEVIVLVGVTEDIKNSLPKNCIGILRTESQDELAELYSAADVFVSFSVQETFGMVTAEAMACGTPVVVNNMTACGEVVAENTGFAVPEQSVNAFYDCINTIREKGKQNYSENCISHIKENFSVEKMTSSYVQIYKK